MPAGRDKDAGQPLSRIGLSTAESQRQFQSPTPRAFIMNTVVLRAQSALERLRKALETHGSAWPTNDGNGIYIFLVASLVEDMLNNAAYFAHVNYTKSHRFTISEFVARAAQQVETITLIEDDQAGLEGVSAAIDELASVLPWEQIYFLSIGLAEAAVYGGAWGGAVLDGWLDIAEIDVETAEAAWGDTVVVRAKGRPLQVHMNFLEAKEWVSCAGGDAEREDGDDEGIAYGLLPPDFWTAERHARQCAKRRAVLCTPNASSAPDSAMAHTSGVSPGLGGWLRIEAFPPDTGAPEPAMPFGPPRRVHRLTGARGTDCQGMTVHRRR